MQVKLINYTQNALETLLYTKNTRLQAVASIEEVKAWPMEKKVAQLDYMLKTIQSSWEFVDYTFEITGVSRAFTHQLVRTRQGSYAQQSQRTVDMSDSFEFVYPENIKKIDGCDDYSESDYLFNDIVEEIKSSYKDLVEEGVPPQDARSILPTNTATNIIAKFDLRTLSDMAKKRLCTRTQGEYQEIFKAMKAAVVEVHPWTEKFIRVYCSAVGVCQFPNYKECPIKPDIFNPDSGTTWSRTDGYKIPEHAINLLNKYYDYTFAKEFIGEFPVPEHGVDTEIKEAKFRDIEISNRPATKDEIEAGFRKMKFEARPLFKGNS